MDSIKFSTIFLWENSRSMEERGEMCVTEFELRSNLVMVLDFGMPETISSNQITILFLCLVRINLTLFTDISSAKPITGNPTSFSRFSFKAHWLPPSNLIIKGKNLGKGTIWLFKNKHDKRVFNVVNLSKTDSSLIWNFRKS